MNTLSQDAQRKHLEQQTAAYPQGSGSLFAFPPALRYPAYRSFWLGTLASVSGFQILWASQLWLVHTMEDSPLYLGYVGLANAIPSIALSLYGGVFADRLDKRRLITVTQTILALLIFTLATLSLMDLIRTWQVLAIAFVAGGVNAFDQPARQAMYPLLIERRVMMSAVALNSAIWQGTRIIGPAFAGIIIATAGTAASFYVAGAGFLAMAAVIHGLRVPDIARVATASAAQDMMEGMRFIKANSVFTFLIGMTFFNSFFGMSYLVLMPVFAEDVLGQGPGAYGALLSAGGVGALITTLWLSSRRNIRRQGQLVIGGATLFGLSVAALGITSDILGSYFLALVLMFITGVFNSTYMISIMSSLQMLIPDRLRGRIMGLYGITWSILPLGGMQAGAVAAIIGAPAAIAIGGLAVSAFALGPAMINSRVRNLGALLLQFENQSTSRGQSHQPSPSGGKD